MAMSVLLVVIMVSAVLFAVFQGTTAEMSAGLLDGAKDAVSLAISMAGVICLWCGVVEVMRRCGLMEKLAKALRLPISALFFEARADSGLRGDIAASVSANLLGLGNAATPLSIRAAARLHDVSGRTGAASDSVCMLVILGSCSIQIIPATIAAARASQGAASPFDILPAVWIATVISCAAGVIAGLLFKRVWR
ncbi:MAG: spore maturation protein A [Oscillospiraceae bacterium]|jgi:spore maturation protein A|nr:spore maturation protein A [Oscillospiraceae bacterium]